MGTRSARTTRPALLIALLLSAAASASCGALPRGLSRLAAAPAPADALLRPGEPLLSQLIALDAETKRYRLSGLKPGASYEVRLSYPASIPATIVFKWEEGLGKHPAGGGGGSSGSGGGGRGGELRRRAARRLLDVEKVVFKAEPSPATSSGSSGKERGGGGASERVLLLSARRRSVHRDGPGGGATHLIYDIVLAELLFEFLPVDTLPVIATAAILLAAVALFTPIWAHRVFPALLDWVTAASPEPPAGTGGGGGSGSGSGSASVADRGRSAGQAARSKRDN